MEECLNRRNLYGTTKTINVKFGCSFSFDGMPAEHKKVYIERRNTLTVACPDEEEQENDHAAEDCEKIEYKESNAQLK